MLNKSTEFISLESSLESHIEEIIGEMTYENVAIDLLDSRSGLVDSPARMLLNNSLGLVLTRLGGIDRPKTEAQQSASRAFAFAYGSSQMIAAYDFSVEIADYIERVNRHEDTGVAMQVDAQKYLVSRPMTNGYIDAFSEELDVSEDGKWCQLAKTVAAMTFKLKDESMWESYLDIRVERLE